jgi:photosystem II stability/assembly factor-like uncharacterized protein
MLRLRVLTSLVLLSLLIAACAPASATPPVDTPIGASQVTGNNPTPTQPGAGKPLPSPTAPEPTPGGPTPSGAWIRLSPLTANPGGALQIQGYLPGGPDQAAAQADRALQYANICWQDCLSGLVYQGIGVTWSATTPGDFTIQAPIPAVPYLRADGPHELAAGDYQVGVQCIGADQTGCALKPALAAASLHLQGEAQKTCPNSACAELTLTPAQAEPGASVQASGWAPLDRVIGQLAFGYAVVLIPSAGQAIELAQVDQQVDGSFTAAFTVPQSAPGVGVLQPGQYSLGLRADRSEGQNPQMVAQAPFQLGSGLAWKDLGALKPTWVVPSGDITGPELRANPSGTLTYCTPGSVNVSTDAGQTWTAIPTAAVDAAAQASHYPIAESAPGQAECLTALADPAHPASFYATFRTMKADVGAPPEYFMGFTTTNSGQAWQALPIPAETTAERFGGFAYGPQDIEALFGGESPTPPNPGPVFGELTRDGGQTWTPGTLACPSTGACLRWGPETSSISGMGSPAPQYVMISGNGGQTWTFPGPSVELRAQGPDELAAFSNAGALLVSSSSDFPVQVTHDAGNNWEPVTLPDLPGAGSGVPFPALQLLPDGSLLALPEGGVWQLLAPGAAQWCAIGATGLPDQPIAFTAAGAQVWWLTQPDTGSGQSPQPVSAPLTSLRCK